MVNLSEGGFATSLQDFNASVKRRKMKSANNAN